MAGLAAAPAVAEKRLALAVGIDVYDNLPAAEQLRKAVSDARAMGKALAGQGFETAVEENLAWRSVIRRRHPIHDLMQAIP
jgi:uncharacterized caspase-like protein